MSGIIRSFACVAADALDCVEIDRLADTAEIVAAQDLADRVSAMLTKLIRSV